MKINEVKKIAADFLKRSLQKDGTLIKIGKTHEGWEAEFEVIEPSAFVRALGIPVTVQERLVYVIALDAELQVLSCERLASGMEPAHTSSRTA
jgi:hypothetical protein